MLRINKGIVSTLPIFLVVLVTHTLGRVNTDKPKQIRREIAVPESVAALVRPFLDMRQESLSECGAPGEPSKCKDGDAYEREQLRAEKSGQTLHQLIGRNDPSTDEALVVLMWFYIGESQEELDAVIQRDEKMLTYLNKYYAARPKISDRTYPGYMWKDDSIRRDEFLGAMKLIKNKA